MTKYYVATADKTRFAYITNGWNGGIQLIHNETKPHFFTFDRAKRVISKCRKENLKGYQIFKAEITFAL